MSNNITHRQDEARCDRGTAVAKTLRRVLPEHRQRDPWKLAYLAAHIHGASRLVGAHALRWQVAHSFRDFGRPDLARAVMRELVVNCELVDDWAASAGRLK